jgi:hypothetical protein
VKLKAVGLDEGLIALRDKLLVPPINMGDAPYVSLDFHIDHDEWRLVLEWYGDSRQFQATGPTPTAAVQAALAELDGRSPGREPGDES